MLVAMALTRKAQPMSSSRLWKETGLVFCLASSSRRRETSSSLVVSALVHLLKAGASWMTQSRNMTHSE